MERVIISRGASRTYFLSKTTWKHFVFFCEKRQDSIYVAYKQIRKSIRKEK